MDSWTDQQLNLMKAGGNSKFKAFMESYGLTQKSPAIKYKTQAAEYYRKSVRFKANFQLKAKVDNESLEEQAPTIETGKELISTFPQPSISLHAGPQHEAESKKSPLDYISSGFFTAVGAVKEAGIKVKDKIGETAVGQKIASAASTTGHFVADKTKMVGTAIKNQGNKIAVIDCYYCQENETMKNMAAKTKSGFSKAGSAISGVKL